MKAPALLSAAITALLASASSAEVKPVFEHEPASSNKPGTFVFQKVPKALRGDAAGKAVFKLIDGERDGNGGSLDKLHDGRLPAEDDQPSENFFFRSSEGGRISVDLGKVITVQQVNSYSWHRDMRGPQVYKLYGTDATAPGTELEPKRGTDPAKVGWKFITSVDTRPKQASEYGGQYGVTIADLAVPLGKFRYLLFDIDRTESNDPFGNTFYSEIDVIDANAPKVDEQPLPEAKVVEAGNGKYRIAFDTSLSPDLTEWVEKELSPVIQEWYPKLVAMLPSNGFQAPTKILLGFRDDMGGTPASAGGGRVNCNIEWFRKNLKGEAKGAVIHELVHVVQQYGWGRRNGGNSNRVPGWVTEGIPDYIRWFLYEPQTRGAEITSRNLSQARYDASYRITGNFINWVTQKYDPEIVKKINAAAREGRYSDDLWKEYTGKALQELNDEWKKSNEERLAAGAPRS